MKYWLDLFTPYTWTKFQEHGASVTGFRPRQRTAAFERVSRGDALLCYLVRLSRWCGALEVASEPFEDFTPIFAEANDPFPIRFNVVPKIILDFEHSIPIQEAALWERLSFTQNIPVGAVGWAQEARLRQSLVEISHEDGEIILKALAEQQAGKQIYALDAADLRHIKTRTVVRTEQGEVEVEVPERDETKPEPVATPEEARE